MKAKIKSGVFFVNKRHIKQFINHHLDNGCRFGMTPEESIQLNIDRLKPNQYLPYSVDTHSGRIGVWADKVIDESDLQTVYDSWSDWEFSDRYKEIYKPRKITI